MGSSFLSQGGNFLGHGRWSIDWMLQNSPGTIPSAERIFPVLGLLSDGKFLIYQSSQTSLTCRMQSCSSTMCCAQRLGPNGAEETCQIARLQRIKAYISQGAGYVYVKTMLDLECRKFESSKVMVTSWTSRVEIQSSFRVSERNQHIACLSQDGLLCFISRILPPYEATYLSFSVEIGPHTFSVLQPFPK